MYKKQGRLFKRAGYMINVNENEAENISHRDDTNRTRPRHGHKYTKYKMRLSIMMAICRCVTLKFSGQVMFLKIRAHR